MRLRLLVTVLFITGLLFPGCRERHFDSPIGESNAHLEFEKYVKDVSMTRIMMTDDAMLAGVSKVVMIDDSTYVVMDRMQRSLAKVTADGRIIAKFQRIGRGPIEYIEMFDFDVDVNSRRLFLLCNRMPSRIIVMDLDFNVEKTVDMDDHSNYQMIACYQNEWYLYLHDTWSIFRWNENDKQATPFIKSERPNRGVHFSHQPVFYKNVDALLINMGGDDVIYKVKNSCWERFYTLNWPDKETHYRTLSRLNPEDSFEYVKNAPPIIQSLIINGKKLMIFYSKIYFRMAVVDIDTGEILDDGIIYNALNNVSPTLNIKGDPSQFFFIMDSLQNQRHYNIDYHPDNSDNAVLVRYKMQSF